MTWHLDKTDLKLIDLLSQKGRMRRNELAEEVGLSIPSVSERLEKLERREVIKGYTVIIDEKKLGYDIISFITINVESSKHYQSLIKHIQHEDEVLECYSITGSGSHLVKAMTQNTASLEKLLARIQAWPGVIGTQTSLVLSTTKHASNIKAEKAFKDIEKIRFEESTVNK
ncbi:MAG: Lrp/AsnC family transcriptional regulator [Chlorobiales bacterium]|jgi:Lrp/AsnC family transcriptional regulator, leucine-responsive regulatory protein|nr:Lrp/AsnC family transcriptional regulator [Chlorobiales bacterium]